MLYLKPRQFGHPDWILLDIGELTDACTQWLDVRDMQWKNVPWFAEAGYRARIDSPNYRRAVSTRAKWQAFKAAIPKWLKYRLLRLKQN